MSDASTQLPPVHLGAVAIDFPVALAAMSGYSDWPTRRLARRFGAGYTLSEALLDQFVLSVTRGNKASRWLRVADEDHPVGAQLLGSMADSFVPAARKLAQAGFDVIDVNFGCPVRKVVKKCRGGWMLGQPRKALDLLARLRDALPPHIPLTIKLRRGLDDTPQSRDQVLAIVDGAVALGVAAITVHGRTVRQRYEGRSSWEFVRELKARAGPTVVFGSGDLISAQACLDLLRCTHADGVMVARGAMGNPWIFRDLRALVAGQPLPAPPSLAEQRDVIEEHYRLAERHYGAKRAESVIRFHAIHYARRHPYPEAVRNAFATLRRPDQWRHVLDRWYPLTGSPAPPP